MSRISWLFSLAKPVTSRKENLFHWTRYVWIAALKTDELLFRWALKRRARRPVSGCRCWWNCPRKCGKKSSSPWNLRRLTCAVQGEVTTTGNLLVWSAWQKESEARLCRRNHVWFRWNWASTPFWQFYKAVNLPDA